MKHYSAYQFSLFRIIFGIYLCIHFIQLIPYGSELFSSMGLMPDPATNFTYGIFPNILNSFDSPNFITLFLSLMTFFSVLFLIGFQRKIMAVLLWYGWACLFNRNNFISNPSIFFVGWLLLATLFIPCGEPFSFSKQKKNWNFPPLLFFALWLIMSVGYTISGIDKLNSPSWIDGTAVIHLLENPLSRNWFFKDWMLLLPNGVLCFLTWSILACELLFLPLAIFGKTRKYAWLSIVIVHMGILMLVDFADLTVGMIMIHLISFDSRWLKPTQEKNNLVFFDGVCGLCNHFIDFLFIEDKYDVLKFAPLQGETAKKLYPNGDLEKFDSIVFKQNDKIHYKSTAALKICQSIGGIWKITSIFYIVPKPIRDKIYDYVAKNRYKWFGEKESCRMPTPKEREKLFP